MSFRLSVTCSWNIQLRQQNLNDSIFVFLILITKIIIKNFLVIETLLFPIVLALAFFSRCRPSVNTDVL